MSKSITEQLSELFELHKSGTLTLEEYTTLKKRIIGKTLGEEPAKQKPKPEEQLPQKPISIPEKNATKPEEKQIEITKGSVVPKPDSLMEAEKATEPTGPKRVDSSPIIPQQNDSSKTVTPPKISTGKTTSKKSRPLIILGIIVLLLASLFLTIRFLNKEDEIIALTETEAKGEESAIPLEVDLFPNSWLIFVKGGNFTMGCTEEQDDQCWDDENPAQMVTVGDFSISKYEVTVEQFAKFVEETNYITDAERVGYSHRFIDDDWSRVMGLNWRFNERGLIRPEKENFPVIYVSWNDALKFCNWLSNKTGNNFRLPSEAEWEFAARGGQLHTSHQTIFSGGNNVSEVAWHVGNTSFGSEIVGTKKPNNLGIYDMSGNVWEWCQDWYGPYTIDLVTNPTGPSHGENKVLRGGSWMNIARSCRVSHRGYRPPSFHSYIIGFRVVKSDSPVQ